MIFMGLFSRNKTHEELEEKEYLKELKDKEKQERQFSRKERYEDIKRKMFGTEEHQYLKGLREKEAKEVESVLTANFPKQPTKSKSATIEELKHLGREIKQEVTEYPKRKFREAAEDIETEREYRKAYREGQKKYRAESAAHRGRRHIHQELYEKETAKFKREQAMKDIAISEKKAYYVEKAKALAREEVRRGRQYLQPTFVRPQLYGIQQGAPQPRRRIYNPFTAEAVAALDPMGIYTLRPPRRLQQTQGQQFQQTQQQPRPNMDWMNFLLGGQENPKSGKRRKVYNFFTGVWE